MRSVLWLAAAGLLGVSVMGCGTPRPPPLDDQTRRTVPIPACIAALPARRSELVGTMRSLRDEQMLQLAFPTFDPEKRLLPQQAPTCTGLELWAAPVLRGGTVARGWPFHVQDGDIAYGSGGDRIKVAWLKLFTWPDGTVGGPIVLVRANERFADLFALGALHGSAERTKLETQRLGDDVVVTAEEDNCSGRKPNADCETHLAILLARGGELRNAIDLASERVVHVAASGDKGANGALEYRLTSTIDYKPDGVHLTEQVQEIDEAGRPIRKAEVARLFSLDPRNNTLATVEPPLWDRFVPAAEEKHEPKPRGKR